MEEEKILQRLKEDVINFKIEDIRAAVRAALKADISPHRIILDGMASGMDVVGQKYSDYEYFLPELVMAGETMNEGVAELKPYLQKDTNAVGTVVLGTVAGDIYDVGKNIVSNIFTAAGFSVVDVGVDVSEEMFVQSVKRNNAHVLGMSALLSSSLSEMKKVIQRMRKEGLATKIIVGGAPLSKKAAREMGADAYGADAFVGVKIVRGWMKEEAPENLFSGDSELNDKAPEKSEKEYIDTLRKMMLDKDAKVRQKAVYALERVGGRGIETLLKALYDEDAHVARNAGITLGRMGVVDKLLAVFKKTPNEFSAIALGRTGNKKCFDVLYGALASDDEGVRVGAVEGLGYLGGRKTVPGLIESLNDQSVEVRCRAIFSLGMMRDARAIGHLKRLLKDESRKVRWRAAWTLGDFGEAGHREAFEALIDTLNDPDWNVRRMIILTLRHDDPRTVSNIIHALGDENKFVRKYTAFVLGRGTFREATPYLEKLRSDESPEVRDMARWAIDEIERKKRKIFNLF